MPINQSPISEDVVLSSWQYEVTHLLNELEAIVQRNRATRGPDFPPSPELGAEHFRTTDNHWYKYDTDTSNGINGWIDIGG